MAELRAHEYQSPGAEQAILGCCLIFPDSIATALEFNVAAHFYQEAHQVVFRAIARLYENGSFDLGLVRSLLEKEKSLNVNPMLLLADLEAAGCVPATLERHCKLVQEQWKRRELIYKLSGHLQNSQSSDESSDDLIDHVGQDMIELHGVSQDGGPRLAKLDMDEVDEIVRKKDRGTPTGLTDLDALIGGWKDGDVYIFAGRPSMGKSALAVKLTHSLAFRLNIPTLVFSLEMSRYQYLLRTVALTAKLSSFNLQHKQQSPEEMERYEAARDATKLVPLIVDGTAGISINAIRYRTRAEIRKSGIKVIVIDYLQIVTYDGKGAFNREQEVARIADGMKAIAKDLGVAVISLAQVSRETERREAQRPRLTDLRECVAHDMRVLMESGQWTEVQNVRVRDKVMGYDALAQKIRPGTVLSSGRSGEKICYEIQTQSGRLLSVSGEHRLFAESEKWIQAKSLIAGDRIAVPFSSNVVGTCSPWDGELCRLLGYLVGNGTYQKHREVGLCMGEMETFQDAASIVVRHFPGVSVRIKKQSPKFVDASFSCVNDNGYGHPFGNPLRKFLRSLDMIGERDFTKRIPKWVFAKGKEGAAQFIAGYLAADGCVKNGRNRTEIHFDTASYGLAVDTVLLLSAVGILGVIQSPCWNTKSTRPMYRIAVPCSHGNHSRVLESIPVIGKRKKALALGLKQGKEISGSDWHFSLPKSVSTYASSVASWRDQGKRMKRNQCLKLATQEKNNHLLKMWGNSDVIWDSVISVKQIGKHQTYDLSVEGVASFIVEGVVTHNSGAIEQVADVVGFIHRPEYYGTTYCEEYGDVTGKAFLFIDKDRNGPTGEVELYWNKNLACFEEYAP